MTGRSACDGCGWVLSAVELVPLVGWLVLRGKCRTCEVKIDPLHPLVEVLAAGVGALCLWLAPDVRGAALALFGWLLLLAGALDAKHLWLPHSLSLLTAMVGLALGGMAMAAAGLEVLWSDRAIGAAAGFAGLWLLAIGYRALRGRDGLGGGDAPFLAAIGAWTGWQLLPLALLFAAVAGLAVAAARLVTSGKAASDIGSQPLPFGTLLAIAVPFALATGSILLPHG